MRPEKRKYKKHTVGKTTKSVHVYIDADLLPFFESLLNKTRYVNQAIREKIERDRKVVSKF